MTFNVSYPLPSFKEGLPVKALQELSETGALISFNDFYGNLYFDAYDYFNGEPLALAECSQYEMVQSQIENKFTMTTDIIIPRHGFHNGHEKCVLAAWELDFPLPDKDVGGLIFFVGTQPSVENRSEQAQHELIQARLPSLIQRFSAEMAEKIRLKDSWNRILFNHCQFVNAPSAKMNMLGD